MKGTIYRHMSFLRDNHILIDHRLCDIIVIDPGNTITKKSQTIRALASIWCGSYYGEDVAYSLMGELWGEDKNNHI